MPVLALQESSSEPPHVVEVLDDATRAFIMDMIDTVLEGKLPMLIAPLVGRPLQIVVTRIGESVEVMVNPTIFEESEKSLTLCGIDLKLQPVLTVFDGESLTVAREMVAVFQGKARTAPSLVAAA